MTVLTALNIPSEFGFVLLVAVAASFQLLLHGFFAGSYRRSIATAEFFRKKEVKELVEVHKRATGEDKLPEGLYPDMGSGRYIAHADYKDWFNFANAQRAHYNYLEGAPTFFVLLFVGGLTLPLYAAVTGAAYIVGRELYRVLYTARGPAGRLVGATILDLALLGLLGIAVYSGLSHAKLV